MADRSGQLKPYRKPTLTRLGSIPGPAIPARTPRPVRPAPGTGATVANRDAPPATAG